MINKFAVKAYWYFWAKKLGILAWYPPHHTYTLPQRIKALIRSAFRFCLTKINKRVFHSYLCLLLAKEGSLCSEGCLLLQFKLICGQSDYH